MNVFVPKETWWNQVNSKAKFWKTICLFCFRKNLSLFYTRQKFMTPFCLAYICWIVSKAAAFSFLCRTYDVRMFSVKSGSNVGTRNATMQTVNWRHTQHIEQCRWLCIQSHTHTKDECHCKWLKLFGIFARIYPPILISTHIKKVL